MRRFLFALFALMLLAVYAAPRNQTVSTTRPASQAGQDAAIVKARAALAAQPSDQRLKNELADLLLLKQRALRSQIDELAREIAALRPAAPARPIAGCGEAAGNMPVRVGGNIHPPVKVAHHNPVYPPQAQQDRVEGIVILEATIDCNGDVADVQILRGNSVLNEAAMDAVRQWKYQPTLLNGAPVPVRMTVTVTFSIR